MCSYPVFPSTIYWRDYLSFIAYSLPPLLEDPLTIGTWVYLRTFRPVPLIYISGFMPVPCFESSHSSCAHAHSLCVQDLSQSEHSFKESWPWNQTASHPMRPCMWLGPLRNMSLCTRRQYCYHMAEQCGEHALAVSLASFIPEALPHLPVITYLVH